MTFPLILPIPVQSSLHMKCDLFLFPQLMPSLLSVCFYSIYSEKITKDEAICHCKDGDISEHCTKLECSNH